MRQSTQKSDEKRLAALTSLARSATSPEVSVEEEDARRGELLDALAKKRALPSRHPAWLILPAAAALFALLGMLVVRFRPSPIHYSVEQSLTEGPFVQAGERSPATIHFDEGSELLLDAASRGRITSVSPHGATFVIENGRVHVSVHHVPGAMWTVEAGPFQVSVVGTKFDMAWRGTELDLSLREGAVVVRGAVPGGELKLSAGQELIAHANGEITVRALLDAPSASATVSVAPPASATVTPSLSANANPSSLPNVSTSDTAKAKLSFSERVAAGDYRGVMDDVDRLGVDNVLTTGSLDDLVALSDAARYSSRADLAKRAMLTERARFAGSGAATSAAFFLGRLSEDSLGQVGEAIGFYEQYLSEAPHGAFAGEALGRLMMARNSASGKAAAAANAQTYLDAYPNGPYAKAARAIIEGP